MIFTKTTCYRMKKIFLGLLIGVSVVACQSSVEKKVTYKAYGPATIDESKAITVDEMLKQFKASKGEMNVTFKAPIQEVCAKAGCWVSIDKGNGETFMVRFKDHFTIPVKTKIGTNAIFSGVLFQDTVSVEMQKHFLEDAGKPQSEMDKITKPLYEIGFTADGILVEQ